MLIKELIKQKSTISYEFFPGNLFNSENLPILKEFFTFSPDFVSVTYGASGKGNREGTLNTAEIIKKNFNIEPMVHLTCRNFGLEFIDYELEKIQNMGLLNIMALRGDTDPCIGFGSRDFMYARDLIKYIKHKNNNISVAASCYPEGHNECVSIQQDMKNLKDKVDCGVDFLVSQLFFDNEIFYNFVDSARKAGIQIPILAGVMPLTSITRYRRIMSMIKCTVPSSLSIMLDRYNNSVDNFLEAGLEYTAKQILDLKDNKIEGIHIYTLNDISSMKNLNRIIKY